MPAAIGKSAKTLDGLFAHPTPANLHWTDVLTLIRRFGTVEHHRHGNLHVDIAGHRLTLKYTNAKQMDTEQLIHLKKFLEGLGIIPGHPELNSPGTDNFTGSGLIIVLDHQEAKLWHQSAADDRAEGGHAIQPHDPRYVRHHLTHRKEWAYQGQRAPEDYEYYKELTKILETAPKAIVIGDAGGKSSAMHFFRDYLIEHHKSLLQRVEAFVDADLSALTEPRIREIAARYWH